jgi:hypothetical protein
MKIHYIVIGLITWIALPIPSYAFPIVEWNTVDISYSIYNQNDVLFSIFTEATTGGAGVSGGGLREADGLWTTLDANSSTIGISLRFFEVNYGDLIARDLAEASAPFADNITAEYGSLLLHYDQSIFLGFQLGGADYCPEIEYGWAQLYFDGESVSVLASATERTGLGIYAGTGTAIPEPATAGLLLMSAVGLAWRRYHHKPEPLP